MYHCACHVCDGWQSLVHAGPLTPDGQPTKQQRESALGALMMAVAALYAFLQANLTGCASPGFPAKPSHIVGL